MVIRIKSDFYDWLKKLRLIDKKFKDDIIWSIFKVWLYLIVGFKEKW